MYTNYHVFMTEIGTWINQIFQYNIFIHVSRIHHFLSFLGLDSIF